MRKWCVDSEGEGFLPQGVSDLSVQTRIKCMCALVTEQEAECAACSTASLKNCFQTQQLQTHHVAHLRVSGLMIGAGFNCSQSCGGGLPDA